MTNLISHYIHYDRTIKEILNNTYNLRKILCLKNDKLIIDDEEVNFLCRKSHSRLYYSYPKENESELWFEFMLIQMNLSLVQINTILNMIKIYVLKYDIHDNNLYDIVLSSNNLNNFIHCVYLIYVKINTQICFLKKINNENNTFEEITIDVLNFNTDDYAAVLNIKNIFEYIKTKFNVIVQYVLEC